MQSRRICQSPSHKTDLPDNGGTCWKPADPCTRSKTRKYTKQAKKPRFYWFNIKIFSLFNVKRWLTSLICNRVCLVGCGDGILQRFFFRFLTAMFLCHQECVKLRTSEMRNPKLILGAENCAHILWILAYISNPFGHISSAFSSLCLK